MELQICYLNNENFSDETAGDKDRPVSATWHSRWKTYTSDWMDEDMKNATVSHYVDRIIINDAQLATKKSVDDMIEFLTKAKESFKH